MLKYCTEGISLLKITFKYLLLCLPLILLFSACGSGGGGSSDSSTVSSSTYTTVAPTLNSNFAVLGPISGATVTIRRLSDNELLYTTTTSLYTTETDITWPQNTIGSFSVDLNSSFDGNELMLVEITGGQDVDSNDDGVIIIGDIVNLQGTMFAISKLDALRSGDVQVSIFSTLAVLSIDTSQSDLAVIADLNTYANQIFTKSIDTDALVTYTDLNGYVPGFTQNSSLKNEDMFSYLQDLGIITALLNNIDLSVKLNDDADNDNLSLADELRYGTNPLSDDTDFDGIKDKAEVLAGSNPINSDSDGDYIPDADDANVLNADVNNNGTLDGLDGDPFFYLQWHLKSNGTVVSNTNNVRTIIGNDLDILDVYHKVIGKGSSTIVQVVDNGVDASHEDLIIDASVSRNAVNGSSDPSPVALGLMHGTAVAGIMAARANNGKGLRGVIPKAVIAGSNWLEKQTLLELDNTWLIAPTNHNILVSNNSWGTAFSNETSFEAILKVGSETLRNNRGRIYVFAAGNGRGALENSNHSYITNNRYAVTVAALNHENKYSSYSSQGSNILVSAYGGEFYYQSPTIATTTHSGSSQYEHELGGSTGIITVNEDSSRNYTYVMNGTSAAAPMVSGAIALVLEACPTLTYRDVRWLIAKTSKKIDVSNPEWIQNSVGLSHNINYGFGLINTIGMITQCQSNTFSTLGVESVFSEVRNSINLNITDNSSVVQTYIDMPDSTTIEWVELNFDSDHTRVGDLEIRLISPSGTSTKLALRSNVKVETSSGDVTDLYRGGFRFSSAAFMGENASGRWRVEVIDRKLGHSGKIVALSLKIYGH